MNSTKFLQSYPVVVTVPSGGGIVPLLLGAGFNRLFIRDLGDATDVELRTSPTIEGQQIVGAEGSMIEFDQPPFELFVRTVDADAGEELHFVAYQGMRMVPAVPGSGGSGSVSSQVQAEGDAAHSAADAGNPIKIGGKASASAPANVSGNDRVNASFDLAGRLRVSLSDFETTIDVRGEAPATQDQITGSAGAASAALASNACRFAVLTNNDETESLHYDIGSAPVATTASARVGPGETRTLVVPNTDRIALIRGGSSDVGYAVDWYE